MFKKTMFVSLVLLLCIGMNAFGAKNLGTTKKVTVTSFSTSESAVDSSAEVKTITSDYIEKFHPETLSDVLNKTAGVSFKSYGALGSLQIPVIRGTGGGRTKVFINGLSVDNDCSGIYKFDLSTIPVSSVDYVEIVGSGSMNSGNTVAAGGIINIVLKDSEDLKKGSISIENGSMSSSLFDSQKVDLSYKLGKVLTSVSVQRAENKYRDNNAMYSVSALANASGENYSVSESFCFQHLEIPGPVPGPESVTDPSPDAYQDEIRFTSSNNFVFDNVTLDIGYTYNPYSGFDGSSDINYKTNVANLNVFYDLGAFQPYFKNNLNYMKDPGYDCSKTVRYSPTLGFTSSFYTDNWGFFAMAEGSYATDMKKFIPSCSIGTGFYGFDNLSLDANACYAVKIPAFTDLFAPDTGSTAGNPNLKPESAMSVNVNSAYVCDGFAFKGVFFFKYLKDAINWDNHNPDEKWIPSNIDKSLYTGLDLALSYSSDSFTVNFGWLWNHSKNLSDGQPVEGVIEHTIALDASYSFGRFIFAFDAKYFGVIVANASVSYELKNGVEVYVKADNVFNTQYSLVTGYPMPGIKVRVGSSWSF